MKNVSFVRFDFSRFTFHLLGTAFLLLFFYLCNLSTATAQKRLTRAESFFGFHFDFHATEKDKELGKYFDTDILEDFIRETRPDYIQIDSKGHPGYSSYPTKVGYSANSFVRDPIRIWRDVTNKYNIPLYVHYSGIWDAKAIHENPQWGRINANGSIDSTKASCVGNYSAKLLLPQLKEMIDWYKIDGVWVDGDCWSTGTDYSREIVSSFLKTTGLKNVPLSASDKNYKKWLEYNRVIYRKYLKNYVDQLHAYKPDFQIASNWAYSSMMPEKVDVNVDFLSGDVSGQNGLYSAAYQARCLALQGKPWDLMAWGFVPIDFMGGIHSPKSLVQLKQEAAEVMSVGGGFQVYFQQNRDGAFRTVDTDAMRELSVFCRERQPFCQYSEVIPEIGMWYSVAGWKQQTNLVYGWGGNMEGINNLLLDGRHSFEMLMDHQMMERMKNYRLIIIPEWTHFDPILKEKVLQYVREGGNLFVIGAKASASFKEQLNVSFVERDTIMHCNIGDPEVGGIAGIKTSVQKVLSKSSTLDIGHIYEQCDYRYATPYPVATINPYGKGRIGALYLDMSSAYNIYRNPVFNKIFNNVVNRLLPDPAVKVTGHGQLHVVLARKNNKQLLHLINASGPHFDKHILAYDEISPIRDLKIRMKCNGRPKSVKLQPDGKNISFTLEGNYIEFMVPSFDVHAIIELVP
ncbi:MAG: alpha-L-fucosidase [Cyclobacteriaceae bacterium]